VPLQQLGFVMSRAVVLQDGDDHRAVVVLEAGDHAERDQRAVLGAAEHDLAWAMGELTGAQGPVQLQASGRVGHGAGRFPRPPRRAWRRSAAR
jgi:hypothetical protein